MNEKTKETVALIVALTFVASVFLYSFIQVYYASDVRRETTFKVFDKYGHPLGRTYVLTYGDGKYIFLGNYTADFQLDHTYKVYYLTTYKAQGTNKYFLKILEIIDVTP